MFTHVRYSNYFPHAISYGSLKQDCDRVKICIKLWEGRNQDDT